MWSGRFREPLDPVFDHWQRSLKFDWQLLEQEVVASKAHALALRAAGILTESEVSAIRLGLDGIRGQFLDTKADGAAWVRDNPDAEDIHHFVELQLSARIGDLALKLHTGRSRNEQIATDLRLYVRSSIDSLIDQLAAWAEALLSQATSAGEAVMPAYTHLQRAEPVLVPHWLLAYVEMILRDASRLHDCAKR